MYNAKVVTRDDLCNNVRDLPIGGIKLEDLSESFHESSKKDIIIFIDENDDIKIIKNRYGKTGT